MNMADIVGILVIIIFTALGYFMGSIRTLASMLGVIFAFKVADGLYANHATASTYGWSFIGIYVLATVVGMLIYGKTRITLIESMEGIFGGILGIVVGWGMARFIYSVALFYNMDSEFARLVASGSVSMEIYMITPLAFMMDSTTSLRNPHPFD
jgi:hypothetical protein